LYAADVRLGDVAISQTFIDVKHLRLGDHDKIIVTRVHSVYIGVMYGIGSMSFHPNVQIRILTIVVFLVRLDMLAIFCSSR
jgi:hypothetical protein